MKMTANIRGRILHIEPLRSHFSNLRIPDSATSPDRRMGGKTHIAAQTGLHKPAQRSQNDLPRTGNMASVADCVVGIRIPASGFPSFTVGVKTEFQSKRRTGSNNLEKSTLSRI